MTRDELITAVAMNYPITALQASDVVELLSAIYQNALQSGNDAYIPGIGHITASENGDVSIRAFEGLKPIISDPLAAITLERVRGITNNDLWAVAGTLNKTKVNVCNVEAD